MTKVSVIMPVYNCEDFLKGSIESILNQTLSDLELICVDDGSTDNSLEILKEFESRDSRVRVFALNHFGGGDARNFALSHVCGEYLYFMDADDVLDLNAFETFYPLSKEKNLDFLMFKAKRYDVDKKVLLESGYYNMASLSKFVKDKIFNFKDLGNLIFTINVTPWCKFYNTKFVLNTGAKFKCSSKFHDNQFFWDIIFQAKRIYFLDEFYYTQNVHQNSLIESCGKDHCDIVDVQNGIFDIFKKHGQFENFKKILVNRKIESYLVRYSEIIPEYKELFFIKMKEDLKTMDMNDFRCSLNPKNQYIFDCILISHNPQEFDILNKYPMDISNLQNWFEGLNKNHKMFTFKYIKHDFSNQLDESFNKYRFKVSIIVPVYNVENYLENSFNSILNQTIDFENLQVIFVDDASSDNSPQLINQFSNDYDNVISIFLDEHSGHNGFLMNIGIKYANAEYIIFFNPKDIFTTNACKLLYDEINSNDFDIVSGVHKDCGKIPDWILSEIITNHNNDWNLCVKKSNERANELNFEFKINSIEELPSVITTTNVWDKIFKKTLIIDNNIKFPEECPVESSLFLLNAILNANGIKFINNIIVE